MEVYVYSAIDFVEEKICTLTHNFHKQRDFIDTQGFTEVLDIGHGVYVSTFLSRHIFLLELPVSRDKRETANSPGIEAVRYLRTYLVTVSNNYRIRYYFDGVCPFVFDFLRATCYYGLKTMRFKHFFQRFHSQVVVICQVRAYNRPLVESRPEISHVNYVVAAILHGFHDPVEYSSFPYSWLSDNYTGFPESVIDSFTAGRMDIATPAHTRSTDNQLEHLGFGGRKNGNNVFELQVPDFITEPVVFGDISIDVIYRLSPEFILD